MFRPRLVPVLLLKDLGLVKSRNFKDYRYIGDPMNAVKIFNDLKADELMILDITASQADRLVSLDIVRNVGAEANMPFGVGGGIRTVDHIRDILSAGAEKVIINTYAVENPEFIRTASQTFGSSAITVCIDVKKKFLGGPRAWTLGGRRASKYKPVELAKLVEQQGAGEIVIQSIDRDGTMKGYDLVLIKEISEAVTIPVVALGGAGGQEHLRQAFQEGFASGLAAGSMFVFHGPKRGVLINYPERKDMAEWFG